MTKYSWPGQERAKLNKLSTPRKIQDYLDALKYRCEDDYCCPWQVVNDRKAHCFDGALFGAAALANIGHRPLIINLFAHDDDEHILAVFRVGNCWGSVSKSNFPGLRYRDPVYRSTRELVMSYFDVYFNLDGAKSLRSFCGPLDLTQYDRKNWVSDPECLQSIADHLERLKKHQLITKAQSKLLSHADSRSMESAMVGVDLAGAYRPV